MTEEAHKLVEKMRELAKTNVVAAPLRELEITACFAELQVMIAEEQEKASARMEQQTNRLVEQTDRLVAFTKGLYWFTAALLVLGVVQLLWRLYVGDSFLQCHHAMNRQNAQKRYRAMMMTPNNALQPTAGVPARSRIGFISIPWVALDHRHHRLWLSL